MGVLQRTKRRKYIEPLEKDSREATILRESSISLLTRPWVATFKCHPPWHSSNPLQPGTAPSDRASRSLRWEFYKKQQDVERTCTPRSENKNRIWTPTMYFQTMHVRRMKLLYQYTPPKRFATEFSPMCPLTRSTRFEADIKETSQLRWLNTDFTYYFSELVRDITTLVLSCSLDTTIPSLWNFPFSAVHL
jgi:hypothetical protein